jgi:hypothetical protein
MLCRSGTRGFLTAGCVLRDLFAAEKVRWWPSSLGTRPRPNRGGRHGRSKHLDQAQEVARSLLHQPPAAGVFIYPRDFRCRCGPPADADPVNRYQAKAKSRRLLACLLLNLPMGGAIAPVPHWQGRGPRPASASPCSASAPYQLLVYASCVLVSTVGCHQTSILFASARRVLTRHTHTTKEVGGRSSLGPAGVVGTVRLRVC